MLFIQSEYSMIFMDLNPNRIGVKYFIIVLEDWREWVAFLAMTLFCPKHWQKKHFLMEIGDFRYLSLKRQHQTGIFVK